MPDLPPPAGKFFPRNLTARADYQVRGNPSGSRPESGVDNCFPGLEFDQRNLDTAFFPGLRVDFHRSEGARVLSAAGGLPFPEGLVDADVSDDLRPLYVRALCGRTTVDQTEERAVTVDCTGMDGLDVWRRVHDLLPGRIAVLVGPLPDRNYPGPPLDEVRELNDLRLNSRGYVRRGGNDEVEVALLVADRARYLDDDGVIEPSAYLPGELTRSLCAPWQYDFRDCGCYYWAASKPDVTSSADGSVPEVNFLRRDRSEPPAPDKSSDIGSQRTDLELTYGDLVRDWNVLPVVLDDREQPEPDVEGRAHAPRPARAGRSGDPDGMTPGQVADKLTELAGVEHALCVEYLYAHYSLNAPMRLPASADELTRRAHAAGQEVFSVAVDEMRHLRWVNEALDMLGRRPVLDRAQEIKRETVHRFGLEPLTLQRLQWFVDVEAPSQSSSADSDDPSTVDGMYVELHAALVKHGDRFHDADRLTHLIKLIIDEGNDHWHRFRAVQRHLAGLTEQQFLRPLATTTTDETDLELLNRSDEGYALLMGTLRESFARRDTAGGELMRRSRLVMQNMHETNHELAARGVGPRFTLPPMLRPRPVALENAEVPWADGQFVREASAAAERAREAIGVLGNRSVREMAIRHQTDTESLIALLARLDGGVPQRTETPSGLPGGGG
ncbi:ferritin-like domain-containing protein [Streptomyces sp. NRRL S-378]|uniref:ferritin-like domain-containing protein n=1 Tax=Streptomyces sp. NRRL S-378 TaxID=1463904 RepID=UPI0004C6EA55|nr:ferritin-like domain-containing protein [Streptomyces sp. NRRL S-378]